MSFKDGSTALFKAALKGHNGVIEELLKFSPSLGLLKVKHAAVCLFWEIAMVKAQLVKLPSFSATPKKIVWHKHSVFFYKRKHIEQVVLSAMFSGLVDRFCMFCRMDVPA